MAVPLFRTPSPILLTMDRAGHLDKGRVAFDQQARGAVGLDQAVIDDHLAVAGHVYTAVLTATLSVLSQLSSMIECYHATWLLLT